MLTLTYLPPDEFSPPRIKFDGEGYNLCEYLVAAADAVLLNFGMNKAQAIGTIDVVLACGVVVLPNLQKLGCKNHSLHWMEAANILYPDHPVPLDQLAEVANMAQQLVDNCDGSYERKVTISED